MSVILMKKEVFYALAMFSMQVIACINMLGLNNELYRSHVELKRHLVNFLCSNFCILLFFLMTLLLTHVHVLHEL